MNRIRFNAILDLIALPLTMLGGLGAVGVFVVSLAQLDTHRMLVSGLIWLAAGFVFLVLWARWLGREKIVVAAVARSQQS